MVSGTSLGLAALALVAIGFFITRKPSSEVIDQTKPLEILFPKPIIIPENPAITQVKGAIQQVESFIKQNFKTPEPRNDCGRPGQFSCGKINFSPLPKGSRFGINPFTGTRIALPVGPRGSSVTERFFGGAQQLLSNQNLVAAGGDLFSQADSLLKGLQGELNILQTNSV